MEEIKPAGLEKNLRKRDRNGNNGTNVIISQAKEINIHRFQQGIRYIVKKLSLGCLIFLKTKRVWRKHAKDTSDAASLTDFEPLLPLTRTRYSWHARERSSG